MNCSDLIYTKASSELHFKIGSEKLFIAKVSASLKFLLHYSNPTDRKVIFLGEKNAILKGFIFYGNSQCL